MKNEAIKSLPKKQLRRLSKEEEKLAKAKFATQRNQLKIKILQNEIDAIIVSFEPLVQHEIKYQKLLENFYSYIDYNDVDVIANISIVCVNTDFSVEILEDVVNKVISYIEVRAKMYYDLAKEFQILRSLNGFELLKKAFEKENEKVVENNYELSDIFLNLIGMIKRDEKLSFILSTIENQTESDEFEVEYYYS